MPVVPKPYLIKYLLKCFPDSSSKLIFSLVLKNVPKVIIMPIIIHIAPNEYGDQNITMNLYRHSLL